MFEAATVGTLDDPVLEAPVATLTTAGLAGLLTRLAALEADVADAERITQLDLLERLKGAAAAAQARVSVDLDVSQRDIQARQGMPAEQLGRGVADQVALARHKAKVKGSRHLGLAKALVREMPHTMTALTAGAISEWRATIVARETAVLSAEDRRAVDARFAPELATLGDAQLAARARAIGYALDPPSVLRRIRGAVSDRRVTIRPAPDTMACLTGFLPVAQGVAVHTALSQAAATARARGDQRSKNQIMADTFVERITGQARADAVPVEIQLVIPAASLLAGDDAPALVPGFGPIPAAFARDLIAGRTGEQAQDEEARAARAAREVDVAQLAEVWLRRLFTSPVDGTLVAMESRRRTFDGVLRRFLIARDQVCRTLWCDAPIRHIDHITAAADDGQTSAVNGQGLCARCNYTKELPGWSTELIPKPPPASDTDDGAAADGRHRVRATTPTGHTYDSTAPPLLGLPMLASPLIGPSVLEPPMHPISEDTTPDHQAPAAVSTQDQGHVGYRAPWRRPSRNSCGLPDAPTDPGARSAPWPPRDVTPDSRQDVARLRFVPSGTGAWVRRACWRDRHYRGGRTAYGGDAVDSLTFIGTATTLLRLGPFKVLTDPNFLHRGQRAYLGKGLWSRRITEPAMLPRHLPRLDLVVLSHLHGDHFDRVARRALDRSVPVITTPQAERRLTRWGFQSHGLTTWSRHEERREDYLLSVESVPAVHARGVMGRLLPPVMGSVLELSRGGVVERRVYLSGDTLTGEHLDAIAEAHPDIDTAVVHLGGTRVLFHTVTMDADQGVDFLRRIRPRQAIPVHHSDYPVFRSPLAQFLLQARDAVPGVEVRVAKGGVRLPL
jgi:L-ascorbate metabolism protein UlaG (beta-lactamase superfamily)